MMSRMQETKPMMHRLRPFWQSVSVVESSVDEEQRASGLVVPISVTQSFGDAARRGVIMHVSEDNDLESAERLHSGMVVYFRSGYTIGDVVIVSVSDVIAYVEDE